ncbi:MAG: hypothetical protein CMK92_05550 [Pseudomonas sp.]|nr:hypothetical protein [Pseudomonas sp.]
MSIIGERPPDSRAEIDEIALGVAESRYFSESVRFEHANQGLNGSIATSENSGDFAFVRKVADLASESVSRALRSGGPSNGAHLEQWRVDVIVG